MTDDTVLSAESGYQPDPEQRPTGSPLASAGRLLPTRIVCRDLSICSRTLARWLKNNPTFPRPLCINGRNYYDAQEFENWKRGLIRCAAARQAAANTS